MSYTFLRSAILVLLSSGLCRGAGVITVDFLRGATGESVTFTTSVKPAAEPFLALTWSFNGTTNIITSAGADVVGQGYENRITLDKSTGSLVLRNLTEKDSGEYELIIIPQGAEQIQGTAKLEVLTKVLRPTIACPTENLIEGKTSVKLTCVQTPVGAELEESVSLSCSADSLPKATFVWKFRHVKFYGPFHYIHEMEERHLGMYTCTAHNAITGLETSEMHILRDSSTTISVSMSMMVCIVLTSVGLILV